MLKLQSKQYSGYRPIRYLLSPAFTIVELLVVIVVIGILAAITIVSYSGITTKANIATMQSDLSNASTKLKMYQTENSMLPATAAAAISAGLITPSLNMDYYSYNVDNVSNPQYFCYMYRKGTDVYAVDSNSAPSKGVCLSNLVGNGDFRLDGNSDGLADGWLHSSSTGHYIDSNIEYFKSSVTGFTGALFSPVVGQSRDKHYISFDAVNIQAVAYLAEYFISGSDWNRTPVYNGHTTGVVIPHQTTTYPDYRLAFYPNTVGIYSAVSNAAFINLTQIFGAGSEPTRAQMDTTMSQFPNNWFNATMKANL